MAYLGVSPSNGVRKVHTYTATASQTTFSGAGAENISLSYRDSTYIDVYQNGVKLGDADYTATSGTSVVLGTGASADDIVVVVVYDVFSVADTVSKTDGGTFDNEITLTTHLNMSDNAIIKLGADADLQISHNGSNSIIRDNGTGALDLQVSNFAIVNLASDEFLAKGTADDAFELYHNGGKRLETTSSGVTVSGDIANNSGDMTIDVAGDIILDADGGVINLNDGGTNVGKLILNSNSGDVILSSRVSDKDVVFSGNDGGSITEFMRIDSSEGGRVGIGTSSPGTGLTLEGTSNDVSSQLKLTASGVASAGMGCDDSGNFHIGVDHSSGAIKFRSATTGGGSFTSTGTERLRLMSTGRLENQSPSNSGNVLQDFRIDWRNENNAGIMCGIGCVRTDNANAPGAFVIRTSTNVDSSSNNSDGEISEKFRVAANGDLTATDTSISSNSDSRLKENISDFAYDLDKFKALKTKTFDWKNPKLHGEKSGQRGFVAQDVETVDSYWIEEIEVPKDSDDFQYLEDKDIFYTKNSTIPDGKKVGDLEYKARFAKTSKLGQKDAMYVSVIQQLLTKIETLEAEVKALKG